MELPTRDVQYCMNFDIDKIKNQFGIIGESLSINRSIEIAAMVARTDLPVLITGETGTGKESFSRIIHSLSSRKSKSFVGINCGAIPEGTIDSELFGHEKGAFTGAIDKRKGYFEEASGGTIFLDEVGEMPLQTQVKLLRVLENGEIIHVGSSKAQKIDVRIVAATNVDLSKAIQYGQFREDLYYRLNTVPIRIPPLRDRDDDLFLLFNKFSNDFALKYALRPIKLTDDAKMTLRQYQFPGNIRQLKNVVEYMSAIEQNKLITEDVVKQYLPINEQMMPAKSVVKNAHMSVEFELLYKMILEVRYNERVLKNIIFDVLSKTSYGKEIISKYENMLNSQNTTYDKLMAVDKS